jgi:hypothetical protein
VGKSAQKKRERRVSSNKEEKGCGGGGGGGGGGGHSFASSVEPTCEQTHKRTQEWLLYTGICR